MLREIAKVGVPYYGWGVLKELLAARMVEAVGALEKDSGFLRTAGGKDYQQRRCESVFSDALVAWHVAIAGVAVLLADISTRRS